jgi:hypothetical protein
MAEHACAYHIIDSASRVHATIEARSMIAVGSLWHLLRHATDYETCRMQVQHCRWRSTVLQLLDSCVIDKMQTG